MTQELRKLAEAATQGKRHYWVNKRAGGTHVQLSAGDNDLYCRIEIASTTQADIEFIAAANPIAILALLDRLEKAEKDSARLDWLEQNLFNRENVDWVTGKVSNTHNMWVTFAPVGVQGSARRIIDSAMEASK